jgi:DNA polymerase-3 subunit epsilon
LGVIFRQDEDSRLETKVHEMLFLLNNITKTKIKERFGNEMKVYTCVDFETTGLDAKKDQITEIGALKKLEDGTTIGMFQTFVRLTEGRKPSPYAKVTEADCENGMDETEALIALDNFVTGSTVIMQYAPFDLSFFNRKLPGYLVEQWFDFIDTRLMAKLVDPNESPSLKYVIKRYGLEYGDHHRALADCEMTWNAFEVLRKDEKISPVEYWYNTVMDFDVEGRRLSYKPYGTRILTESRVVI